MHAPAQLTAVNTSQGPEEKFREYLASRPHPLRYTTQQRDLVQYIFRQHNHFDAEQLIDAMKQAGFDPRRATVYRTLSKLVDAGLLRRLDIGPRAKYEHDYGYPRHEHLQCSRCGKMIEFQGPAIEDTINEVCRQHHFHADSHTLIIRGTCADCNRANVTKRILDLV